MVFQADHRATSRTRVRRGSHRACLRSSARELRTGAFALLRTDFGVSASVFPFDSLFAEMAYQEKGYPEGDDILEKK
jgi:hypothetical protein